MGLTDATLFQGVWFPAGEVHMIQWMEKHTELVAGRGTYQIEKFREAMKHVREFRTAIDVGAHVGMWSMQMAGRFAELNAFEPVEEMSRCFRENMNGAGNVTLHHNALGDENDSVTMSVNPVSTGDTFVLTDAGKAVEGQTQVSTMRRLDDYGFEDVDFIKIDCEGYEDRVLAGAVQTLKRCHPCVIVEQKARPLAKNFGLKGTPAVDLLTDLGAVLRLVTHGDYILSWD